MRSLITDRDGSGHCLACRRNLSAGEEHAADCCLRPEPVQPVDLPEEQRSPYTGELAGTWKYRRRRKK